MRELAPPNHRALRSVARQLKPEEIISPEVQQLITDLKQVLAREKFGVAIAAPQVGESVGIFVVAGKVIASRNSEEYDPITHPDEVYINPEIIKSSRRIKVGDEGCLSVPGKYGTQVARHEKVTIRYRDEHGEPKERGASGFLARIFQHEIDHLHGVLYTDDALQVIDVDEDLKPLEK